MANKKRNVYKPKPITEGKRNLIQGLLQEYEIETAEDIQDALNDLLSGTIQDMMESEMNEHLGYDKYERPTEPNYQNGLKAKTSLLPPIIAILRNLSDINSRKLSIQATPTPTYTSRRDNKCIYYMETRKHQVCGFL